MGISAAKPKSDPAVDEAVLAMLREGNPDGAQRLIDVFGDRIYGLSIRILASAEDAEEAVQETFLIVWQKWSTFKEHSKFSSWIYRIAANQAYMKLRKRKKRANDVSLDQFTGNGIIGTDTYISTRAAALWKSEMPSPDEEMEQGEILKLILSAVDTLAPGYRTAYLLKDIEGLTLKEIAEAMNLSEPAVKSRVHRARLTLRKKLQPILRQ
ncbi:MAG: RNA polymerase sigma-70 factor (ECF subfamily) [Rhodothermales bacterium]|jgi:RNA polymerase sigma-70 factor (ECF subfamily)